MEATSPKWTEGSDPSGLEELQTKALRPLRGDETLTTMNRHELKDIVARRIVDEHRKHGKSLADGNEWAAIAAAKIIGTLNDIGALAAAKEEHGKHEICPPHVIYEAVGGGMICSGCEQRFAPANGLDVEGVMRLVNEHDLLLFNTNRGRENFRKALEALPQAKPSGIDVEGVMKAIKEVVFLRDDQDERIRKALEAHAEKGGDNLRTDTCDPDCRDHGGIEGCSCSECSTPLGPPVFMTYCGGCGKKVNWPEGTDMMPSEWAYPQRKDAEKEDSNLRKPWPYTPTEELARRVPPDTDKG